jgi:hypothetical protein
VSHRPVVLLKRALLACWAAWLSVVFAANVLDGMKAAGLLPESWAFASGNYRFLADEVFVAYPVEGTHLRLFTAQLAVELLSEGPPRPGGAG